MTDAALAPAHPDPAGRLARLATAAGVGAALVRLHIVAIACLATSVFGWAFTGRWLWLPVAACAVDWFAINFLNRVVDRAEDARNGVPGTGVVAARGRLLSALCLGALAASLVATHLLAPALTLPRLACHAIGFPYNYRLLPGRRRFKELYGFKNPMSAAIFLDTCFLYPLAVADFALAPGAAWGGVALVAAFFFLFELSYEVIYDLRDVTGDRAEGVQTFPVVHGERAGAAIAFGLMGGSLPFLVGGYAAGLVPWRLTVMALAPVLQVVLTWRFLRRGPITARQAIGLTWLGAGLLAAYHAWVWVGLPLEPWW